MSEYLTMEEIKERYPDEWVLLEDPKTNEYWEIVGGTVHSHSQDKSKTLKRGSENRPVHSALVFTGEPDPDVAYLL